MSFYIQHGYGKGQKIANLAAEGKLRGVVLSPADEDHSALAATANMCRGLALDVRIDPQSYIYSTVPPGLGKHHKSNGLQFTKIHWSQDAKSTSAQIDAVGRLNQAINTDGRWIAPSVVQSSFTDVWTPLALQMARTASDAWGPDRTIATVAIDEAALDTWATVNDWLDVATTLQVRGFQILVNRSNTSYPPVAWSVDRLTNLLRLIYNLAVLNGYEVSWSYSDTEGLLGIAVGANQISSGWNYTLRQFNTEKWQPNETRGGRAPIPRYHVPRLWSPLRVDTEAERIRQTALSAVIFMPREVKDFQEIDLLDRTRAQLQEQHLALLASRSATLSALEIAERLEKVRRSLEKALRLFARIEDDGVVLEARYRPRVSSLLQALQRFTAVEKL